MFYAACTEMKSNSYVMKCQARMVELVDMVGPPVDALFPHSKSPVVAILGWQGPKGRA